MAGSVGSVYADALFELCKEQGNLTEVYNELTAVRDIVFCKDNEEYAKLLCSKAVSQKDGLNALENVFGGRVSEIAFNFLCVLCEKKRLEFLPDILTHLKARYNEENNILEVLVIVAEPLSDRLKNKLTDKLAKLTGKKISLAQKVDRSVMGGIKIRYDKTEIDATVKTKLEKLRKQIDSVIA